MINIFCILCCQLLKDFPIYFDTSLFFKKHTKKTPKKIKQYSTARMEVIVEQLKKFLKQQNWRFIFVFGGVVLALVRRYLVNSLSRNKRKKHLKLVAAGFFIFLFFLYNDMLKKC